MIELKQKPLTPTKTLPVLFTKQNYIWMLIGGIVIALGMMVMTGGKNENPAVFDTNVVYSSMRITVAPILIVAGLLIEVYAIFKAPKQAAQ